MAAGLVANLFNPQRNFKTLRFLEGRGEELLKSRLFYRYGKLQYGRQRTEWGSYKIKCYSKGL